VQNPYGTRTGYDLHKLRKFNFQNKQQWRREVNVLMGGLPAQKENRIVDTRYPLEAFFFILHNKKQCKILPIILAYITVVAGMKGVFNESSHCSTFVKRTDNARQTRKDMRNDLHPNCR
jgi:hypothetical protein